MIVKSIKLIKNKVIHNSKGDIIKFISSKKKYFPKFGELYFSEIKKNATKGWNIHYKYQCILTVPYGKVRFSFYNPIQKKIKHIQIDKKKNYHILIPKGNWFCFKSLTKISIVVNFLSRPHNKKEMNKSKIINGLRIK